MRNCNTLELVLGGGGCVKVRVQYQCAVTCDHEVPQTERFEHLNHAVKRRHLHDLNGALVHERAATA